MTTLLQLSPGDHYVAWAVSTLLQATAVLTIAWILASLLARQNAAARYATWLVALGLLLLSPLTGHLAVSSSMSLVELSLAEEPIDQPMADAAIIAASPPQTSSPLADSASHEFSLYPSLSEQVLAPPESEPVLAPALSGNETPEIPVSHSWSLADYLRVGTLLVSVLWIGGIGCFSARLAWRARRLSRLLQDTLPLEIPAIEHLVRDVCRSLGLRKTPELRIWASPTANLAPITVGAFRPMIVLSPAIFSSLPSHRLRDALVHECAHVLRQDVFVAMIQRIAVIGFWPHPLVWLMDRGLSRAREEVCDNFVLRDSDSTTYAETLLEVCQRVEPSSMNGAQLGLFERPWRLEQRIAGLLDDNRVLLTRIQPLRALILCAVLLTAVTVSGGVRLLIADPATTAAITEENQASEITPVLSNMNDPAAHDQDLINELGLRPMQPLEDGGISTVDLRQCKLTVELVQKLKGLSALNGLSLMTSSSASDNDLALLPELPTIEVLWLDGKQVTPTAVSHLQNLTKLTQLHVNGVEITDSSLELLAGLSQLEFLGLSGTDITPSGLGTLKRFPKLKGVTFQRNTIGQTRPGACVITDAELQILAEIPTLTSVTLGMGCEVTDQGMAALGKLAQLEELTVYGGEITDVGLAQLQSCSRLKKLSLSECKWFTDDGLTHLRGLTELQELELSNGAFTDAGMAHLEPLRKLETLSLGVRNLSAGDTSNPSVTDAGLQHLSCLTQLERLSIQGGTFTDAGLAHLSGLTNLRRLHLQQVQLTEAGFRQLGQLINLTRFSFDPLELTDRDLEYLKNLTRLQSLLFIGGRITDAGLSNLRGMADLRTLVVCKAPVTDTGLANLAGLQKLEILVLQGTRITDAGLTHLHGLQQLSWLDLSNTGITDEGLAHLSGLDNLQGLTLTGTLLDGHGLVHLVNLPRLQGLHLGNTGVSDEGLRAVAQIQGLTGLSLDNCPVTGTGLAHLKDLQELVSLSLTRTSLTDDGLAGLAGATKLESLDLSGTQVTDAGLAVLSGLQNLQSLTLGGTRVTDDGLSHLHGLGNLRNVSLRGTSVTAAGIGQLQKALPSCDVRWDAEGMSAPRTPVPGRPTRPDIAESADSGVQNVRSDADLDKLVPRARGIRALAVSEGMLTPAGAKRLKEFPDLQLLFFHSSFINDSILESISDLPNLAHLSLNDPRVGDTDLVRITKLPKLRNLELSQTTVTSDGLRVLENAPSLQELTLMGRQFDDKTLESLSKCHSLRSLSIHGGSVTDEGLKYLIDYPQLESFAISCPEIPAPVPQITDKGLEFIAETKINQLFISRAAITDAGLKYLEKMTTLRSLTLRDTDVTTEGMESLEKALPALRVMAPSTLRTPSTLGRQ